MNAQKKILSITPICCLIIYLLMGFLVGGSAWGWGLLVFLLVPLMPYIVGKKKITITVTLVVTLIYVGGCLIAQFGFDKLFWHPGWIIFLTIPVIKILSLPSEKDEEKAKQDAKKEASKKIDSDDEVYEAK